jgi:hypothetical protein
MAIAELRQQRDRDIVRDALAQQDRIHVQPRVVMPGF